jgi:hypothetical protein
VGGALDHLGEQLAGPADERQALLVLVGPRAFPYKHQPCLLVTGTENDLLPPVAQATAFAVTYIFADSGERVIGWMQSGKRGKYWFGGCENAWLRGGFHRGRFRRFAVMDGFHAEIAVEGEVLAEKVVAHGDVNTPDSLLSASCLGFDAWQPMQVKSKLRRLRKQGTAGAMG